MARDLGIPHGSRVSGFVNWLVSLKYVRKVRNRQDRINTYRVVSPLALIKFYSNFRNMTDQKLAKNWSYDRDKVIEYLKGKGGVFCLTTALEHYTKYIHDPAINVYVPPEFWNEMQGTHTEGSVRVNMYPFLPDEPSNITEKDGLKITTKLRTLIDLYCNDKAYAGDPLVKLLWP